MAPAVFELHSGFWINLHHRLYEEPSAAKQRSRQCRKTWEGRKPACKWHKRKIALSAAEQRAWDDAVSITLRIMLTRTCCSAPNCAVEEPTRDFETCEELSGAKKKTCDAGLPPKLTQILDAAGPVYRVHRWAADDRANRAWITRVAPSFASRA